MLQGNGISSVRRVVLVGKTGLDAALRLDQGLELSRVVDLREALAEVSLAGADASDGGAGAQPVAGCTVVLSDAVWTEDAGRRARFIDLARAGCAGLRVLRQVPNGALPSEGGDGVVSLQASPEAIRSSIRGEHRVESRAAAPAAIGSNAPVKTEPVKAASAELTIAPTVAPVIEPVVVPPAAIAPAVAPIAIATTAATASPRLVSELAPGRVAPIAAPPATDPVVAPSAATTAVVAATSRAAHAADARLVESLLLGQDIEAEAVAMIRTRLGDSSAEFVPQAQAINLAGTAFSGAQCPVAWGGAQAEQGATYGLLRAARAALTDLQAHAAWLAGWLRLRDQQAQLREAAFTDPLTGAWNRRYFDRFMAGAIEHARTHRHFLTVFVFDLDNFKKYNDQFGHEAGDEILRQTVQLLRSVVRPTDRVCRLGGDEFVVIFDEPEGSRQEGSRHPTSVAELAKRFQRQLAAHRFPQLSQVPQGSLTISGGLATYPWDGSTAEELLHAADRLLIQSKRQGKNVIELGGLGNA
jgi:diguanylate cyclase (GGDEF)-like protein